MNRTAIEWCDMTWNPVTGCLHGCPYCYARNITNRFKGKGELRENTSWVAMMESHYEQKKGSGIYYLRQPLCRGDIPKLNAKNPAKITSYPFGFAPTFHKYRLEEPQRYKNKQNIFVCSMADLFGDWVPQWWIEKVFEACKKAPQHRYLFLTKNPSRYVDFLLEIAKENFWIGVTLTGIKRKSAKEIRPYKPRHSFLSIEPLCDVHAVEYMELVSHMDREDLPEWVIIGAETGNRKGKIIPQREWIKNILNLCRLRHIPVFMKNSLAKIWSLPLIQEYPWGKESL